jgi:uncharacterized OsmC-like protein
MSLNAVIDATADAVAQDPSQAGVVFRASGRTTGPVGSVVTTRQHTLTIDEPPTLGGEDTAANPVEVALAALISCQVVTYRFWAEKLGIPLDDVEIDAEGDLDVRGFFGLDDGVRPGFTGLRLIVRLAGPASAERYQELQAAVDAHCPVLDLFAAETPVLKTLDVATRV